MNKSAVLKSKLVNFFLELKYLPAAWVLVSIIYIFKSPMLPDKIFAEDGFTYIQESLDLNLFDALLTPYAGYGDVISRLGGELVILLPIHLWSYGTFLYSTFWLALILLVLIEVSSATFQNKRIRIIAPLSLLLLPIGNFDAHVSMSFLRFFFLAALFPIFLSWKKINKGSSIILLIVMIAPLMTPLTIIFLPFAIKEIFSQSLSINSLLNKNRMPIVFVLSSLLQIIFVVLFAFGERKPLLTSNTLEVIYLLLDRVIGSSLIPGWGLVSQPPAEYDFFAITLNNTYLIRAIAALTISLFIFHFFVNIRHRNSVYFRQMLLQYSVLFLSWFFISFLWAPEPRYALAIGFWFLWTTLQVLDFYLVNSSKYALLFLILIPLTWITSWEPSGHRTSGGSWTENFPKSQSRCLNDYSYISIKIGPTYIDERQEFFVRVKCNRIL